MRFVAMIPARLGSKRVKKKNLRMLGDKPLIAHVLETAVKSNLFDDVYVNSESEVFAPLAKQFGAKFYKRPDKYATDDATNDQFALDFIENVPCDVLVQINPTSPFQTVQDFQNAVDAFRKGADTVLAVKEARIEGVLNGEPLNFDPNKQMPRSQDLTPVYLFCNGVLAWKADTFKKNMENHGCAVYGGDGKTVYLEQKGDSVLDIDNDEDFKIAEIVLARNKAASAAPKYWGENAAEHAETHVFDILKKDGVALNDLEDANHEVTKIQQILDNGSKTQSWSKRIINSASNCVTIISQMPGEGNRRHYHNDWDEWWYILEGEWVYEIEGVEKKIQKGDVVFISRNRVHKVTAAGSSRAIRMAVSRDEVAHIYVDKELATAQK